MWVRKYRDPNSIFAKKTTGVLAMEIAIIVNGTPTPDLVIDKAYDLAQHNNISPNQVFPNKYKTQFMNPLETYLKQCKDNPHDMISLGHQSAIQVLIKILCWNLLIIILENHGNSWANYFSFLILSRVKSMEFQGFWDRQAHWMFGFIKWTQKSWFCQKLFYWDFHFKWYGCVITWEKIWKQTLIRIYMHHNVLNRKYPS